MEEGYKCDDCGHIFTTPRARYSAIDDEQYDFCPHCDSEDFEPVSFQREHTFWERVFEAFIACGIVAIAVYLYIYFTS